MRVVLAGIAIVGAALVLTAIGASLVVYPSHGAMGVWAAIVAAAVCWTSAGLALVVTAQPAKGPQAVVNMMLAMLVRMAGPLAIGAAMMLVGGPLAEAGLFGLMVVHYLVALLVETVVAVRLVAPQTKQQQPTG
jgi:hypothetical protein